MLAATLINPPHNHTRIVNTRKPKAAASKHRQHPHTTTNQQPTSHSLRSHASRQTNPRAPRSFHTHTRTQTTQHPQRQTSRQTPPTSRIHAKRVNNRPPHATNTTNPRTPNRPHRRHTRPRHTIRITRHALSSKPRLNQRINKRVRTTKTLNIRHNKPQPKRTNTNPKSPQPSQPKNIKKPENTPNTHKKHPNPQTNQPKNADKRPQTRPQTQQPTRSGVGYCDRPFARGSPPVGRAQGGTLAQTTLFALSCVRLSCVPALVGVSPALLHAGRPC